jgi:protoporphyrinogen oxidase
MISPPEHPTDFSPPDLREAAVVLGGGLAGLSAGYHLDRAGMRTAVFEAAPDVGGLSRTIRSGDFLYDIGGHRFFTRDESVDHLIRGLMGDELITVQRTSTIYLRGRFFDYPLRPANAVLGMGMATVARAFLDYGAQRLRRLWGTGNCVSLEDWVIRHFGRTMFDIYFREYSEKVWGLDCSRISQAWVAKRIEGLSLSKALRNALFRMSGREIPTLVDTFLYPRFGIGRIAERFREEIVRGNSVHTDAAVVRLGRNGRRISDMEIRTRTRSHVIEADSYVSTVPLNALVRMLDPGPPPEIAEAARRLRFRDLTLVAVKVERPSVTDQTWVYVPEKKIPFGRLHEPKLWSGAMAPRGQTLVVVEFFCTRGDSIWNESDENLARVTIDGLQALGFLEPAEVFGTEVLRVPRAYPLFEVGYEEHCETICRYLEDFENLHLAGRSGMFQYQNMDHAIVSGRDAARKVTGSGDSSP